jgi:hypothetical protein
MGLNGSSYSLRIIGTIQQWHDGLFHEVREGDLESKRGKERSFS